MLALQPWHGEATLAVQHPKHPRPRTRTMFRTLGRRGRERGATLGGPQKVGRKVGPKSGGGVARILAKVTLLWLGISELGEHVQPALC